MYFYLDPQHWKKSWYMPGKDWNAKALKYFLGKQLNVVFLFLWPHPYVGPHLLWIGAIFEDRVAKPAKVKLHEPNTNVQHIF